ncbi:MAG TPA: hypothetical protein VGW38_04780 [Chloroflexota bacterium]|nr:hypothetical protein [Chloroflexota bacterium]
MRHNDKQQVDPGTTGALHGTTPLEAAPPRARPPDQHHRAASHA